MQPVALPPPPRPPSFLQKPSPLLWHQFFILCSRLLLFLSCHSSIQHNCLCFVFFRISKNTIIFKSINILLFFPLLKTLKSTECWTQKASFTFKQKENGVIKGKGRMSDCQRSFLLLTNLFVFGPTNFFKSNIFAHIYWMLCLQLEDRSKH